MKPFGLFGIRFSRRLRLVVTGLVVLCLQLHGSVAWSQADSYREALERFNRGDYLQAWVAARTAVEQDGQNVHYRRLYGLILAALKQYSEARGKSAAGYCAGTGSARFSL